MARESIEERRARLMPGASWIRAERERRGWSGRELARRMDIAQDRVSAYERAQDEPPASFARRLAEVYDIDEVEVWRCLRLPLPQPFRSDEELIAYALDRWPNSMAAGANADGPLPKGGNPAAKDGNPRAKKAPRPRTGERDAMTSPDAENAV